MPVSNVFKNIMVASELEEAVIITLVKWFPTYLREIESQLGLQRDSLMVPRNYTNRNSFDDIPGDEIPKVVVISPGTISAMPTGSGQYRAVWRLGVAVATAAQTEAEANQQVKIYGAAVRKMLLDNQSLDKNPNVKVAEIRWFSESYEDLPIQAVNQLYKAASIYFDVDCENVVTKWSGPKTPDQDSYTYGLVQTVKIDLVKEAIT